MRQAEKSPYALFVAGLFVITLLIAVQGNAASATQARPGVISWWDGDSLSGVTASDLVNGNNATLVNGTTTAAGKIGNAFSFDGVNDFISVPSSASLVPANAVTVELWAKINSIPDAAAHLVDAKITGVGKPSGLIYGMFALSDGRPGFGVNTTNGDAFAFGVSNIVGDGQFHHIAGTWDGSIVKLYVDGVLEGSAPASGVFVSGSQAELIIGDHNPPDQTQTDQILFEESMVYLTKSEFTTAHYRRVSSLS